MKFSNNFRFKAAHPALHRALIQAQRQAADRGEEINIDYAVEKSHGWDAGPSVPDNATVSQWPGLGWLNYGLEPLQAIQTGMQVHLQALSRQESPLEWAATQDHLGNILIALGQGQGDAALLQSAVDAFELALQERTQEKTPDEWANSLYNLGVALMALGQLQSNPKTLSKSVDAFTEAVNVWGRKTAPHEWATTMFQLGQAFHAQGLLLKGHRSIEKAVVAYKNALAVWIRDDEEGEPFFHAMAQNNRGAALQNLAEREENAGRMEEAIRAYYHALSVWEEQLLPMPFAVKTIANLNNARMALAELTQDVVIAQEAVDDYELITEIYFTACDDEYLALGKVQLEKAQELVQTLSQ